MAVTKSQSSASGEGYRDASKRRKRRRASFPQLLGVSLLSLLMVLVGLLLLVGAALLSARYLSASEPSPRHFLSLGSRALSLAHDGIHVDIDRLNQQIASTTEPPASKPFAPPQMDEYLHHDHRSGKQTERGALFRDIIIEDEYDPMVPHAHTLTYTPRKTAAQVAAAPCC